jgi:hypothetical protein
MTLIEGVTDIEGAAAILESQVAPGLKGSKGYAGITASADRQAGVVGVLATWETEADLDASDAGAAKLRGDAVKSIGGKVGSVGSYELMVLEVAGPASPGDAVLIIPSSMDPAKVEENTEFFKATVLPQIKAIPGLRIVRNMVNRQTGQGRVGIVLADDAGVAAYQSGFEERRRQAAERGVKLEEPTRREVIFTDIA